MCCIKHTYGYPGPSAHVPTSTGTPAILPGTKAPSYMAIHFCELIHSLEAARLSQNTPGSSLGTRGLLLCVGACMGCNQGCVGGMCVCA